MKWTPLGRGHQKEKLEQLSSSANTRMWVAFAEVAENEYIVWVHSDGLKEAVCPIPFDICASKLC